MVKTLLSGLLMYVGFLRHFLEQLNQVRSIVLSLEKRPLQRTIALRPSFSSDEGSDMN